VNPMMAAIVGIVEISVCFRVLISVFQLLNSQDFQCGEEILTIAAMTSVQVCLYGFHLSH
jgi:hypothetical protein